MKTSIGEIQTGTILREKVSGRKVRVTRISEVIGKNPRVYYRTTDPTMNQRENWIMLINLAALFERVEE